MSPKKIVRLYKQKGYNCIAITDHNTIEGALEAKKYENSEISVIIGEEISTDHGDLIAIGLKEAISSNNFYDAIEDIKKQHAFSILPHPYKGHKNVEKIAEYVDYIEIFNARTDSNLNSKARILAKRVGKPGIAGSDAHQYGDIGSVKNYGEFVEDLIIGNFYSARQSSSISFFSSQIIKSIKAKNIKFVILGFFHMMFNITKFIAICCFYAFYFSFSKFIYDIFFRRFTPTKTNADVLFSSYLISWRNYMHKNGKRYESDLMIGAVIDECKKNHDVICIDICTLKIIKSIGLRIKKLKNTSEWICFESFLTYQDIVKSFRELLFMRNSLGYNKTFEEYFIASGEPKTFSTLLRLKTSQRLLLSITPKVVVLTCEYCSINKQLSYLSRIYGIPVVALQHGIFTERESNYIFQDEYMQKVIPDITCVFGKYFSMLLTEKSIYKSNQVMVTGNPRYDIFPSASNIFSLEDIRSKFNIKKGNRIILWTTQCHGFTDGENLLNFETVFSTMQGLENTTLVIKQHPNEGETYTKMIYDELLKYDIDVRVVPKNCDTLVLQYISDIIITIENSTIGLEAVALEKALLILNLNNESNMGPYVEGGVAIGIHNKKDLIQGIIKLLSDDTELAANRQEFIQKYLYRIDGRAAERVAEVIHATIKEAKCKNNPYLKN